MAGPDCVLAPHHALGMTLLMHELATNALKHGALSRPEGRVTVAWSLGGGPDDPTLDLIWAERGGPPVSQPQRRGFGSRMMARALGGGGVTTLEFDPDGLVCRVKLRLANETAIAA